MGGRSLGPAEGPRRKAGPCQDRRRHRTPAQGPGWPECSPHPGSDGTPRRSHTVAGARDLGLATASLLITCALPEQPEPRHLSTHAHSRAQESGRAAQKGRRESCLPTSVVNEAQLPLVHSCDQVWPRASWRSGHTWREDALLYYPTWRELAFSWDKFP